LLKRGWDCAFLCDESTTNAGRVIGSSIRVFRRSQSDLLPVRIASFLEKKVDLFVLDHYELGFEYERACRQFANGIMVIDDLPGRRHDADILIDATPGRSETAYRNCVAERTLLLTGSQYALLRPEFARLRSRVLDRRREEQNVRRLVISMGLTDPLNITGKAIAALREVAASVEVDVILGSAAPHLRQIMEQVSGLHRSATLHVDSETVADLLGGADVAIGSGGLSCLERCCLGLPSILIVGAQNQESNAQFLTDAGAVLNLGWHADVSPGALADALNRLIDRRDLRASMSHSAARICDGEGAARVADALSLFSEKRKPWLHGES
jgi:UDP-2,4-diacetamido-2,4,6-trideoxy-beta-L-altropyranose hydrolase